MTYALAIVGLLTVISLGLGLYFRVAEYDILAADKVWDRIAPAAQAIVDDDSIPDSIAGDVTAFAMLSGCGCFTSVMLINALMDRIGVKTPPPSEDLQHSLDVLDDQSRLDAV
jgi:hypothetical protein